MSDDLLFEIEDHTAVLTLNRPTTGNALGGALPADLVEAWRRVRDDSNIRAAIITGAGDRHFCTGAQVDNLDSLEDRHESGGSNLKYGFREAIGYTPMAQEVMTPVIVAINGVCAGAGFHFVHDADIVLCSETASFVEPHVSVGQVSALEPIGLSRRIPLEAVLRMNLIGRWERMTAERAHQIGLVGEITSQQDLLPRAREIAALIARNSPAAVRATKKAIWNSLELPLNEAMAQGWEILMRHWDHPDQKEGPAAFGEKRDPEWSD